jgi:5-methylcytosine-specific restriction endonuclease McrA
VPLLQGGTHRDSNLQALCKPCHSKQHPYGQHPKSPI